MPRAKWWDARTFVRIGSTLYRRSFRPKGLQVDLGLISDRPCGSPTCRYRVSRSSENSQGYIVVRLHMSRKAEWYVREEKRVMQLPGAKISSPLFLFLLKELISRVNATGRRREPTISRRLFVMLLKFCAKSIIISFKSMAVTAKTNQVTVTLLPFDRSLGLQVSSARVPGASHAALLPAL